MKTLNNLDKRLMNIHGKEYDDKNANARFVFVDSLGCLTGADPRDKITGEELIRAYNLGVQIRDGKEGMQIEDADAELLKKAIEKKAFGSDIYAQVMGCIE